MQLLGEVNRDVIPLYAQELFIGFLMDKLRNFEKHEIIALMTLIVIEGSEGENSLDESIVEFRVFEKNEVNIFGETFMIRKQCMAKLKEEIARSDEKSITKIVAATQKFASTKSEEVVESFLQALMEISPEI